MQTGSRARALPVEEDEPTPRTAGRGIGAAVAAIPDAAGSLDREAAGGDAARLVRSSPLRDIRAYYEETWSDYRRVWFDASSAALHFGFRDESTRSHAESLARTNAVMAEHARFREGMTVLDAGCGVGGTAMWLAARHPVHVTGITITPDQVRRARELAEARGLSRRVRIECRDMTDTGFPSGSFDVVYAIESSGYALDKQRFFDETHRVLRPGGRLVVLDGFRRRRTLPKADARLLRSWLADWAIPDLSTLFEARRAACRAGFGRVTVTDVTANVVPSLRRLYRLATVLGPFESILRAFRVRSARQHRNVLGARKQWIAMRRGLWRYAVVTAEKPEAGTQSSHSTGSRGT